MALIPTFKKEKLPQGFSYPIGAERISSALGDAPQFGKLRLICTWRDEFWASKYAAKVNSNGVIEVFTVDKSTTWPDWSIRVRAVPSSHAVIVRERLDAELLRLRSRLCEAGSECDWFRHVVTYDLASSVVAST